MGTVFEFNRRGCYTIETAREMLSLVYKITSEIDQELQLILGKVSEARAQQDLEKVAALEEAAQSLFSRWESKILKLGLEPKGIWLVDFDSGNGYFCWKYPELDIKFWHGYEDGFSGRKPLSESPHFI